MVQYIPQRGDIVWLDFDPVKGREIGKYRPALVLSDKDYNQQTGLLICCPVSTSIRGGLTEVFVKNLEKPSVVACSLIQTLSWKDRSVKKITRAEDGLMKEVLTRLLPLMGAEILFED
ncbi:type II toxin-antitoxin system PemK/MazF family toxin [Desulfobotulus mexicanus]|uniref:MazF family transcriptional regulator n=1 Tax=Desulfobotulus mexicanus TaxID=2586642 RepID=A0A5S5MFA6_9BACT|nr:type II toxin-antitoxin system PemK/MazF family toxin [Desulfobotulus mexicanus]TYT74416.1 MazF family transcriptional regulator [Desulfobotulus mexicanus]